MAKPSRVALRVPAGTIDRLALKLSGEKTWKGLRQQLRDFYHKNVASMLAELNIVLAEAPTLEQSKTDEANPAYVSLKLTKR